MCYNLLRIFFKFILVKKNLTKICPKGGNSRLKKYEMLYIISAKQTEEQREALIAKVQKMVEDRNGSVENIDKWGMKKLAYPIQFQNEGFYVLMNFEVDPLEIRGLENALNIIEPIVRKMIVSKN